METFIQRLDRILAAVLIVLVFLMVLSITTEIVLNAFVQPVASGILQARDQAAEPSMIADWMNALLSLVASASAPVNTASQTILVWIGILGSALALRHRAHLGVDAVVRFYPAMARRWLDYLSTILIALFSLAVFVIGGVQVCINAFQSGSRMPGIEFLNHGWFYLVLCITGVLNLIYCAYHLKHPIAIEETGDQAEESPPQ